MLGFGRALGLVAAVLVGAIAGLPGQGADAGGMIAVKLGLGDLKKTDRAQLWKRVDEYAIVEGLHEFCGKKLNIERRAWKAVGACIDASSLRRVAGVFRSKKATYVKAWEAANGDAEKKTALCDQWRKQLGEYAGIISRQIAEAASLCRACLFC